MRDVLTLDRLKAMDVDAAAALLAYRRADGAGDLDAAVLDDWLALDQGHAVAWADAQAAWQDFDGAEDDEILAALRADARRAKPSRPRWVPQAAAAVAVLTIGAALGVAVLRPGTEGRPAPVVAQGVPDPAGAGVTYATAEGVSESFRLADGTRLTLSAGSVAKVNLASARRDVRLMRGEAFFDVAHDAARPFAVRADRQEVVALGTRFDVALQPAQVRVILVEGRVSVRAVGSTGAPTLLRPGQQLVSRDGQAPVVSPVGSDPSPIMQDGYVDFENVTLAAAAKTLNGRGAGRVIVKDPRVAGLRISGRFKANDLPRFGVALTLLHPVRFVKRGPQEWEVVWAR